MRAAVWRERWARWLPPLVVALAALGGLLTYRVLYAGRVEVLRQRAAAQETRLGELRARRQELEAVRQRAAINRDRIDDFYADTLSTERRRLTQALAEIKELARRSGLSPGSISYPTESFDDWDLHKRGVVFSVSGTYDGLRQLINLLELSGHFVALEQVELSDDSAGNRLGISLRLSLLFGREKERS